MAKGSGICVGALAGAFGVRGEARLKSFCADPAAIADYGPFTSDDGTLLDIRVGRPVKGGFAARIKDVRTREAAEALKGTRLFVPRDRLPEPGEDEFYHSDLLGLAVYDTGGILLGKVKAVLDHGAGDLLELALAGGGTALLPFTRDIIPTVDLTSGRLIADPPEGALPE